VESEELDEFGEELGFLRHLCNEVAWTGGKRQGGFSGAEDVELLLVFQNPDVWVTCKGGVKGRTSRNTAGQIKDVFTTGQTF